MQTLEDDFKKSGGKFEKYQIEDLFTSSNGNFDIQKTHINGLGNYVVSSGVQNSGIIGKTNVYATIFPANTITIDMFGNVFYRDFPYKMVTHARVFSLSFLDKNVSAKSALYISANMKFLNKMFSYSDMASWEKIKSKAISVYLPTKKGKIDFDYMENYISELEKKQISKLENYLQVSNLENCNLTAEEQKALDKFNNGEVEFKEFRIGDLFDIHPTAAYKMTNIKLFETKGNIPVVTNSSANNGITGFVNLKPTEKGGIITYSDTTTSEGIFYQPDNFVGYSHVQGLYPFQKDCWGEKSLLYFVSLFRRSAAGRFDYANKFNRKIASEMLVYCPIMPNGSIDYNFMETYITAQEKLAIKNVVLWKDRVF